MTSRHDATPAPAPASAHDGPTETATGLSVHAWSRPHQVTLTVGSHQVIGHALAERKGREGHQVLVSLDGGHLTWVAAQRVTPASPPRAETTDLHGT